MKSFPSGTVTFLFTDIEGSTAYDEMQSRAMTTEQTIALALES